MGWKGLSEKDAKYIHDQLKNAGFEVEITVNSKSPYAKNRVLVRGVVINDY